MKYTTISLVSLLPAVAAAAGTDMDTQNVLQPSFQFQHQTINLGPALGNERNLLNSTPFATRQLFDRDSNMRGQFEQYDAKITYPFGKRDNAVNLDLGINIRFINADYKLSELDSQKHHLNATLPMFHATALFNLPFDGLSASLGGSHTTYDQYRAYDYKAKFSYSWENGFGLEGGWQHQQLSIEGADSQTQFELKGPFLDLKYRF